MSINYIDRDQLSRAFQALSDPTRRDILARTSRSLLSIGAIAKEYSISQPAVSKHLAVLTKADLITTSRHNKYTYVAANHEMLRSLSSYIQILADVDSH